MSIKDAFIEAVYPAFMAQGYFEPTARAMAELAYVAWSQVSNKLIPTWTESYKIGDLVTVMGIVSDKTPGHVTVKFGDGVRAILFEALQHEINTGIEITLFS